MDDRAESGVDKSQSGVGERALPPFRMSLRRQFQSGQGRLILRLCQKKGEEGD